MKRILQTLFLLFLIFIAVLPFLYQVVKYRHYTNDDAYITFRYSRNLAEGKGPFFNTGEQVEGYTNFLQMLQAAAVIRIAGPDHTPTIIRVMGILYGAGSIALTFLLFRATFASTRQTLSDTWLLPGALAAAAAVGISPSFAVNCTSGLETSMFAFWLTLGLLLGIHERTSGKFRGAAIAFALALLTRPEGALLFAAFWFACAAGVVWDGLSPKNIKQESRLPMLIKSKQFRILLANGLFVTFIFFAHLVFRYVAYNGEWLPNTYFAKKGGFWAGSPWSDVYNGMMTPFFGVIGAAVALAGILIARRRLPKPILYVAAMAVAGASAVIVTGVDWMIGYRMVIPYLPMTAVLIIAGWILLLSAFKWLKPQVAVVILILVISATWFTQNMTRKIVYGETFVRSVGYKTGHIALANWIAERAKPGDGVALMDIGIIGYKCIDQQIIDITGLTDRFIAKSQGKFLQKIYDPKYILDKKPEFIVLTLQAGGTSYTPPPQDAQFNFWTPMEARLASDPLFDKCYRKHEVPNIQDVADWHDVFASMIGADKVFEHAYPGLYYLLAVYQRNPGPENITAK